MEKMIFITEFQKSEIIKYQIIKAAKFTLMQH